MRNGTGIRCKPHEALEEQPDCIALKHGWRQLRDRAGSSAMERVCDDVRGEELPALSNVVRGCPLNDCVACTARYAWKDTQR